MTRLIVLLMTNLDGDFDPATSDPDATHPSLFLPLMARFPSDYESGKLLYYYSQVIKMHIETLKDKDVDDEYRELICRDILPRHLMRDMVTFGLQRSE